MKFPGLQELSSFVQFQHLEIGVVRVSALGNRKHCLNSSHPPRQMPRLTRGWVRVGREYAPESVNCAAAFMAPQIHFLMMWSGGTSQDDCRVLSCPQYERMNTDTAFKMSAAGGSGIVTVLSFEIAIAYTAVRYSPYAQSNLRCIFPPLYSGSVHKCE